MTSRSETLGQRAYTLRATRRLTWAMVAEELYGDATRHDTAAKVARYYALAHRKPWPLPADWENRGYRGHGKLEGADLTRPATELCREYGCTSAAVSAARKRAGMPLRPRVASPWTAAEVAKLHRLRRAGFTFSEIAEELGRTAPSVAAKYRDADVGVAAK